MDPINVPFGAVWQASAFVLAMPALAWAAWTAPWRRLAVNELAHVWLGAIFFLTGLWTIKASLASGLVFHLLGVPMFTLLAGPQLALIGTGLVVAIATALRDGAWANYAVDLVAMGAVPVLATACVLRAAERWLAPNLFVYIFVAAFFGPALAMLAAGVVASAAVTLAGALPTPVVVDQFLPYLVYLAFGEATVTGMLVTLLVVYHPTWVATFDDGRYLRRP